MYRMAQCEPGMLKLSYITQYFTQWPEKCQAIYWKPRLFHIFYTCILNKKTVENVLINSHYEVNAL